MNIPYTGLQEFPVKNKVNLFQSGRIEFTTARNILNTTRRLLGVSDPETDVVLVGEKSEIIKLVFRDKGTEIMSMYYIPKTRRLDIYDSEGLLVVFERKKSTYQRATEGLKRLGFDSLFRTIVAFT